MCLLCGCRAERHHIFGSRVWVAKTSDMDWFRDLFGFSEQGWKVIRSKLQVVGLYHMYHPYHMYSETGYWTVCKIPEMLAFFRSLPDDNRHFLALSGDLLGSDRLSFLLLLQTPRNVPLGLQWCFLRAFSPVSKIHTCVRTTCTYNMVVQFLHHCIPLYPLRKLIRQSPWREIRISGPSS